MPKGKRAALAGDELVTAFVRRPHGVKGFVRLESASGETEHIEALKSVYLRLAKEGGSVFEYQIEEIAGSPAAFLVKFAGIDTPEEAAQLAGAEVLVPRDKACPLSEGEFYVADLCQCVLVYEGNAIGRVKDVMEGGGGFLLGVVLDCGETRLVPFRDEFVGEVNIAKKTVELLHAWVLD